MNFNHDTGAVTSILTIDTTVAPPLGGSQTLQIIGNGGLALPSGTEAQRPNGVPAGTQRWSTTLNAMEVFDGTAWVADEGGTVTSVTVESANNALVVTNGTVTGAGTITLTLDSELLNFSQIDPQADGPVVRLDDGTYVAREFIGTAPVTVTNGDGVAGNPTISVNAELTGLAALDAVGLVYRTGAGAYTEKTLAVSGDLTLDHTGDTLTLGYEASGNAAGLDAMTGEGIVVRTNDGLDEQAITYASRAIEGTSGNVVVTNGAMVAGNAVVDLAEVTQGATGSFLKVTLDGFGRVTGNTAVVASDITGLVDSTYVNVSGDTMSGNLSFGGTATVIGLTTPQNANDAATKGYVDSLAGGLSWQEPVASVTAGAPTGPYVVGERYLNTVDSKVYTATATDTLDAGVAPADGWALFDSATETGYVYSGSAWVQFTGAGQIVAGNGLSKDGNTINVNLGAGIAQLPSDEVGIDVYTGSALFLTVNGADASTDTAAQLALRVGAGITQNGTNGIFIDTGDVTNAMLANSTFSVTGNAGNGTVALGGSLAVNGAGALSTAYDTGVITISAADASTTVKGVASFNTDQFSVTAGAVSLAADLEDLLNVDMTTAAKADGDLITWDATAGKWVPISQNAVAPDLALDDLTDVVITSATSGDVVYFNGTNWVNGAKGSASGVQAYDAGLDSLAALATTGIVMATAADTFTTYTLVPSTGISLTPDVGARTITVANTGVTSVGLDLPSIFTVSGSPVTTTGTLTGELATQAANMVFAGPATGVDAAPTFRALVPADVGLTLYKENGVSQVAPSATGNNAVALGSASAAALTGELAHASGYFAASGDAQGFELVLRNATSDATATELFLNGTDARATLANNTAWTFTVQVIGLKADGTAAAGYRFDGVALRGANAAATSFIGTPSKNILGETSSTWDAVVSADTTNGALAVTVTGAAATSIRWVATVRGTQVKF